MEKREVTLEFVRNIMISGLYGITVPEVEAIPDEKFLQSELIADLGLDSLDVVEMTMEIERELHLSIAEEMFDVAISKPITVADYIDGCNKYATNTEKL